MVVKKLTAERIASAAFATGASYYILEHGGRDAVSGFGVRVGRREKTFVLRHRGTPHKIGAADILPIESARRKALELRLRLLGGESIITSKRPLSKLRDEYLTRHAQPHTAAAWAKDQERMWDLHVLPFRLDDGRRLGTVPVVDVTADHLSQLHVALQATPFLANRVIDMLGAAFNKAALWKWRDAGEANPAKGIQRYPERSRRARHYTGGEYQAWGAAITQAYATAEEASARTPVRAAGTLKRRGVLSPFAIGCCELLVYTGARPGEGRTLDWSWLDPMWDSGGWRGRFRLPVAKGDRPGDAETGRDLWLNAPAFAVLRRMAALQGWTDPHSFPPSGPVFRGAGELAGRPIAGVQKAWKRLCESAGIADATPKTLRHSFVTEGTPAGVPRELMQDLAGHSSPTITDAVYRARVDASQRDAAEQMGAHLARQMGVTDPRRVM